MRKALFLDRDGIINIDHGYVSRIEDFDFSEGIFRLLSFFKQAGYIFYIVTNQSGIGRGYYSEEDFQTLSSWMIKKFKQKSIDIASIYHCPHAPEANCNCRKPLSGMLEKYHNIDFNASWMIGDKQSDINFAHNAQIRHTIAIGTRTFENYDYLFTSIQECADFLEENPDIIRS